MRQSTPAVSRQRADGLAADEPGPAEDGRQAALLETRKVGVHVSWPRWPRAPAAIHAGAAPVKGGPVRLTPACVASNSCRQAQVAELMGITDRTVRRYWTSAMATLHGALREEGLAP